MKRLFMIGAAVCLLLTGCSKEAIGTTSSPEGSFLSSSDSVSSPIQAVSTGKQSQSANKQGSENYSLEQAMSDNAQLSTIAFSGLAFITGYAGADSFFPPGKVADFFGFQYMRDVDTAGYGHNTLFLSRVANNVLYILNDAQKAKLVALAKEQASIYTSLQPLSFNECFSCKFRGQKRTECNRCIAIHCQPLQNRCRFIL
jgi:hypothetical protein